MNENKSEHSIVSKTLLQICSTNKNKPELTIVNEPLLQNYSTEENELSSTEEDKS